LVVAAAVTGLVGDALLQAAVGDTDRWGLGSYFRQHGRGEALCIAAGMMTLFYVLYLVVLKLPPHPVYLALYGVVLDLIFREARLFPSLKGYYEHLNYAESAFWGAVPLLLPWLVVQYGPSQMFVLPSPRK